jgi:hypothetical protein
MVNSTESLDIDFFKEEDFEVFWWKYRTSEEYELWALFERSELANYLQAVLNIFQNT